jgi:uncharacterized protein (DUF2267 family)
LFDGMALDQYCRNRGLVSLSSTTSAYDATRALEDNHSGAILVHEEGRLVGIVTDRDLACRVVGFGLDPNEAVLADIMTPAPATVSVHDTEDVAASVMRDRHVRRLPVLDGDRTAGIVTLDDLVLSGAVERSMIAAIIEAQLAEPARAKPPGETHPTRAGSPQAHEERRDARAADTLRDFQARLGAALGLDDRERALMALQVVASGIARRLTPGESSDFASQFPSMMRDWLLDLPAGPDRHVTREAIDAEMAERLHLEPNDADYMVQRVGAALGNLLGDSEIQHVATQLPMALRSILVPEAPRGGAQ